MEVFRRFTYDFGFLSESSRDFLEMMTRCWKDKGNLGFSSETFHLIDEFNEDSSSKS